MLGTMLRISRTNRSRRPTATQPTLEALEHRLLLYSTLGGQWTYGQRITYSFAPDGIPVGLDSHGNTLHNKLHQAMANRGFSEQQWKDEFRQAAASWAMAANINLVEVPEVTSTVLPLGVSGFQQGDSRFGDIRIVGAAMPSGVLGAASLPPPFQGGTLAGDIMINTNALWQINHHFDLQTVALHEIGHALGLGHSQFETAVMYDFYNGIKQWTTSDDIAGIRSIYGPRQHDVFDAQASNNHFSTATNITPRINSQTKQLAIANLDITSLSDSDWYFVQAPPGASGTMTITMQSTGLSSLSPRLQVYNSALQLAGWRIAPDASTAFGATISLTFTNVPAGTGVYIWAYNWNGAASGPNGVGTYGLQVNFGTTPMQPFQPPNTQVASQPNQGGGWINQTTTHDDHDHDHSDGFDVYMVDPKFLSGTRRNVYNPPPELRVAPTERVTDAWLVRNPAPPTESGGALQFPDVPRGPGGPGGPSSPGVPRNGPFNPTFWLLPTIGTALEQVDPGSSNAQNAKGNANTRIVDEVLEQWD